MNRLFFSICLVLSAAGLFAQAAPPAVYVLYNSQNMDILDYRMAYGGNSTTAYYAYTFKPGTADQYVLYTGNGVYADYLPNGTQTSRDFKLTDDLMTGVNGVKRQLFVVQQQQRGYVVSPVVSVTKITKSGNYYLISAAAYSFILDTDNVLMGRELSTSGSRSSVTLTTFGYQNCKYQYSFKRTANMAGAENAEFDFIPGIGVSGERSGRNAAELQSNQVTLWGINGLPLNDYITKECGGTTPPKTPTPATTTPIEPRLGEPATGDPQPIPSSSDVMISAISNHPVVNCNKQASPGFHIVQPKETLNGIARFYGVTVAQLKVWNNVKDPNKITVCQELRVAANAVVAKSPVQQIKSQVPPQQGTVVGPKIVPPTPAPNTPPVYQPVQPNPQGTLPQLFDPGTAPATYSSPQPTVPVPSSAPATTPAAASTGQYYAVQPGEGVYTIAKKFGFTDERFRTMNNFPPTGAVALQVGQLVKVSDCEHAPVQTFNTLSVTPATARPGAVQVQPGTTQPVVATQPTITQPAAPGFQPLVPVTSSTNTGLTQPGNGFVPLNPQPAIQPTITQPDANKPVNKKEPIGFKDYFVRDSETLKDIARKQQLDASELSLINGKDQNEVLPPGTRIQLPIY